MRSQFQLLSKIIDTKDFSLITLNNISEDYFFNYKAEFKFIKNHYDLYDTVPDKLTFLDHFPDFVEDGSSWVEVKEPDSFLLEQLEKDYKTSFIANLFNNIKPLIESGKQDEAIRYFLENADNMPSTNALSCVDIMSDLSRYEEFADRLENGVNYNLKTGFPELDRAIGGIDLESENMVIVARTGKGKTWLLCIMAAAAVCQGKTVGFYSGEMTVNKVAYRIDTIIGNGTLDNKGLTRGIYEAGVSKDKVRRDYKDFLNNLEANAELFMQSRYPGWSNTNTRHKLGSLKIITPNDIPGEPTVDALKGFIEKFNIDILFVDQYSLLEDTSKAKVEHERVANISKAIKRLQVKKRIPIISVSQQNRTKNEDGKQDTTQVAGSDRIPQDATTLLMLDRDKSGDRDILKIKPQKVRDGGEGFEIDYYADFNLGLFEYIDERSKAAPTKEEAEENDAVNDSYN